MPHTPELEAIPTAGTLVGRHLIVREIAKGTIGPLYLTRTQNADDTVDTLARVIPLPADLPARDDQLIAEAIWDSANVGHDMVLRVADVVAGNGWVTLVHDFHMGTLIGTMHRRARDLGNAFPAEIAARVTLDVLEGLEQSRGICEANQIPWRPGSVSISSLYVCADGRTRALDGQVMAAVLRSAQMRMVSGTANSVAPEVLDDASDPDERTDVFAVGTVLWELLTGREILVDPAIPVANVILSVPRGTSVPQGLVHALHRALELDPARRQSTLRELAVELVMGAEKVATYEQVIEFASTLLPYDPAFQTVTPDRDEPRKVESHGLDQGGTQSAKLEPQPSVSVGEQPVPTGGATTNTPSDPHGAAEQLAPRFASPFAPTSSVPPASAVVTPVADASLATSSAHEADKSVAAAAEVASPIANLNDLEAAPTLAVANVAPRAGRLEQISWPDDEAPPLVAAKSAESIVDGNKKSNGAKAAPLAMVEHLQAIQTASPVATRDSNHGDRTPAKGHEKADVRTATASESANKTLRKDSGRPATGSKSPKSSSASGLGGAKVGSTKPRAATKPAESAVAGTASQRPGENLDTPVGAKKGGLQVSMTTLILAVSTAVLAVVLVMILMQRNSSQPTPTPNVPPAKAEQAPLERSSPLAEPQRKEPASDRSPDERASSVANNASKAPETKTTPAVDPKADRQKRTAKTGASTPSRAAAADDDSANDDAKAPKKPKNYVPSDL